MLNLDQISKAVQSGGHRPETFPYGVRMRDKLDEIRNSEQMQPFRQEVKEEAARALAAEVPQLTFQDFQRFEKTGSRREFESLYFDRRRRLLALALVAVVEDTDEYIGCLNDLIWEICNEYSWCVPAHLKVGLEASKAHRLPPERMVDLFAAETAHALAETVYLLQDRLNPWIVYRVRSEVERRVFSSVFHSPAPHGWESATNNWSSVCAGAVGMAAMLLEEDRVRLSGMLHRMIGAMECFLQGYGDDGGCAEGAGYWNYGFGYYVYFAEMLYSYTNGQLDLMKGDKVRSIAGFPLGIMLSGGSVVNYSDSGAGFAYQAGLAGRLTEKFGLEGIQITDAPSMLADHCYRFAHSLRNVFWTDLSLFQAERSIPEGTVYFPDLEWIVDRRYIDRQMVAFSAKGGHNDEPHNHNDIGHFILHVGGENLFADLGAGLYTKDYFGPGRYTFLNPSSEGHSVPIVNGRGQQGGENFKAKVLQHHSDEDRLSFVLELGDAYGLDELTSLRRSFVWNRNEDRSGYTLELTDSFLFNENPASIEEIFISLHEPKLRSGSVVWSGEHGQVEMRYDPLRLQAECEQLEGSEHHGEPVAVYRVRLHSISPGREETIRLELVCIVTSS